MSATLEGKSGVLVGQPFQRQLRYFTAVAIVWAAAFALPFARLVGFSRHSEFFSYIPLVPFITAYLVWTDRKRWVLEGRAAWLPAVVFLGLGAALMGWYRYQAASGAPLVVENVLSILTLSALCFFWGICLAFLGGRVVRQLVFPLAFLIFMVPLPSAWLNAIESFFQLVSAIAAMGFCSLVGTPVSRDGMILHLPGQSFVVAPECSGIHSTMVLVMTALLAGYLFLTRPWPRVLLVAAILPLSILRNGFRIFVIGELCVHIGPRMIDSPIHRRGGPVFFVLALIPLLLLLVFLRKYEVATSQAGKVNSAST